MNGLCPRLTSTNDYTCVADKSAKGFINAMKGMNMKYQLLPIDSKIDTSDISLSESASKVKEWIISCM